MWNDNNENKKRWMSIDENILRFQSWCEFTIEKTFYKKKLKKSFDNDDLYMHNKQNTKMFKIFARDNIYIINQITFELNELTLITTMMSMNEKLISIVSLTLSIIIYSKLSFKFSLDFDYFNSQKNNIEFEFNIDESFKKRDLYTFWHRRFNYMSDVKFKNLHKITTLKKSIFIV